MTDAGPWTPSLMLLKMLMIDPGSPCVGMSRPGMPSALASHEKSLIEEALRATGGRVFGPAGAAAR